MSKNDHWSKTVVNISNSGELVNKSLSIPHHSVQHLPSCLDLLYIYLSESKPDLIAISEYTMMKEELDLLKISNNVSSL